MVSVLLKELEYKVTSSSAGRLEVMQATLGTFETKMAACKARLSRGKNWRLWTVKKVTLKTRHDIPKTPTVSKRVKTLKILGSLLDNT